MWFLGYGRKSPAREQRTPRQSHSSGSYLETGMGGVERFHRNGEEPFVIILASRYIKNPLEIMNTQNTSTPESSPKKSWFKRHPFLTGLGVFIILGFFLSLGDDTKDTTQKTTPNEVQQNEVIEVLSITAPKLAQAYIDNEVGADITYKDTTIKVSGVIKDIGKDILDLPYLLLESNPSDYFTYIQCMFPKENEAVLASMKKGTSVTLQGKVSGKLGSVILRNCSVVTP